MLSTSTIHLALDSHKTLVMRMLVLLCIAVVPLRVPLLPVLQCWDDLLGFFLNVNFVD